MTCHDTGDSFTRSQGVQYVQCTVQLPVSGLTPGVHLYSPQAGLGSRSPGSVGSGQSWVTQVRHRSDVTTDQLVMSDVTLLQKQTISHRMPNRR